ncbi:hypothetical protein ACT453_20035, partial [Bacillus sp. D-CC]
MRIRLVLSIPIDGRPQKSIVADTFISGSFVLVDNLGGIYVFYEQITDPNPADMIPPQNNLNTPNRTIRMLKSVDGGNTFPINVP